MNLIFEKFIDDNLEGTVYISNEVIASIAGAAALEVEGVVSIGEPNGGVTDWIGKKNNFKNVAVLVNNDTVAIDVSITTKYGYKLHETSRNVQNKIKAAIEAMTGLSVISVNVHVVSIADGTKQSNKQSSKQNSVE